MGRRVPEKVKQGGQQYEVHPDGSVYRRDPSGCLRKVRNPILAAAIIKGEAAMRKKQERFLETLRRGQTP